MPLVENFPSFFFSLKHFENKASEHPNPWEHLKPWGLSSSSLAWGEMQVLHRSPSLQRACVCVPSRSLISGVWMNLPPFKIFLPTGSLQPCGFSLSIPPKLGVSFWLPPCIFSPSIFTFGIWTRNALHYPPPFFFFFSCLLRAPQ